MDSTLLLKHITVFQGMKMPLAHILERHKWTESSSIVMAIGMLDILMRQTPKFKDVLGYAIESPSDSTIFHQ